MTSRPQRRSRSRSGKNAEIALAFDKAENHHQQHRQELHDRLGGFCKNASGMNVPVVFIGPCQVLERPNPQFLQFQKVHKQQTFSYQRFQLVGGEGLNAQTVVSRNDASLRSRMVVTTVKTNGGGGFRFSIFVQVVLCIVIVHVSDSSYPLPLFGSKSFVNSDSFEVHNQNMFLQLLPTSVH